MEYTLRNKKGKYLKRTANVSGAVKRDGEALVAVEKR